jgi:ammonium transporter, Amt family
MCFIKYVLRIPLRMSEAELLAGSDMIHGEAPYVLGSCEAHEQLLAGHSIRNSQTGPGLAEMPVVTLGQDPHVDQGNVNGSGSGIQEVKMD